jgi:hypothetical protein
MLLWFIKLTRGMFTFVHHLVRVFCFALGAVYFCPAAGRRPAGAGRRGLRHGCCGLGGLEADFSSSMFFFFALIKKLWLLRAYCAISGVAGPYPCGRWIRRGAGQNAGVRDGG